MFAQTYARLFVSIDPVFAARFAKVLLGLEEAWNGAPRSALAVHELNPHEGVATEKQVIDQNLSEMLALRAQLSDAAYKPHWRFQVKRSESNLAITD